MLRLACMGVEVKVGTNADLEPVVTGANAPTLDAVRAVATKQVKPNRIMMLGLVSQSGKRGVVKDDS